MVELWFGCFEYYPSMQMWQYMLLFILFIYLLIRIQLHVIDTVIF